MKLYISIVLFLGLAISAFIGVRATKAYRKSTAQLASSELAMSSLKDAFLENVMFSASNSTIKKASIINERSDTVEIASIFTNETILVFRLRDEHCMTCVEKALHLLKTYSEKIGQDNIALLASYRDFEELKKLKKVQGIPFRIFNTADNIFQDPHFNGLGMPFYFLLHKDLTIQSAILARLESSESQKIYLQAVADGLQRGFQLKHSATHGMMK